MTRHKVLILDSNTADRTRLRQLLPNGNYEIAEASNGQEGLALIHQERGRIRFILIDAYLPQIDGWAIVQHLQADPSLNQIPLVILVEAGDRPPASTYPFLELLTKPFNRKQLKQVVKSAIQKAKAAQAPEPISEPTLEPVTLAAAAIASPTDPSTPPPPPIPTTATSRSADDDLWSGFNSSQALPEDFPEEFQHPPELPDFPLTASDGIEGVASLGDDLAVYTTSDEDQAAVSGLFTAEADAPSTTSLGKDTPSPELPSPEPPSPEAKIAEQSPANPITENIFAVPTAGQFTEETGVLPLERPVESQPEPELPIVAAPTEADMGLTVDLPELEPALPEGDPFAAEPMAFELASQLEDVDAQLAELQQTASPTTSPATELPADLWREPEPELTVENAVEGDDLTQVADFEFNAAFAPPIAPPEPVAPPETDIADAAATDSDGDPFASFEADFAATDTPEGLSLEFVPDESFGSGVFAAEPEAGLSTASSSATAAEPEAAEAATETVDEMVEEPAAAELVAEMEVANVDMTEMGAIAAVPPSPPDPVRQDPAAVDPFVDFESDFVAAEPEELQIEELSLDDLGLDSLDAPSSVSSTPPADPETTDPFDPFADLDAPATPTETDESNAFELDDLLPTAVTGAAAAGAAALASAASPALTSPPPETAKPPETQTPEPLSAEVLKPIAEIEFNSDDRPEPLESAATLDTLAADPALERIEDQDSPEPIETRSDPPSISAHSEAEPFADLGFDSDPDWLSDPAFQFTPETDASPAAESSAADPEPTAATAESLVEPLAADPFGLDEAENTILGDKRPEQRLPAQQETETGAARDSDLQDTIDEAENTILGDHRSSQTSKDTDTETSRLEQQLDAALTAEDTPEYTVLEDKREDGDFAGFAFEDPTKKNQRPLLQEGMVTLRGFDEVKMRFESAIASERIAAMHDAIAFDEPGHQLIFQALREEQGSVREAAEQIISNRLRQSANAKPLTQQAWLKMDCLQVIMGHSYWVQTVAIADDNRTLVTGSKDSTIKTWDLFTGQELRTIRGHSASVLSIALSSDSKKIISSSTDNTIKIWNLETGEQLQVIEGDRHHKIYVVALSADDQTLISASAEQTAKPQFETDLEGLLSYLPSKSMSPLLGMVSFFRRSREIKLWDVRSGKVKGNLLGYSKGVTDLAVTPKGDLVVSGSRDHTVKVWNLQTKRTVNTLWGHTDEIRSVAISPDGKTIISGSRDKTIKIWDLRTGHVLRTLRGHSQSVTSVAVSPDGKTIVSGSRDATVKIWDFESGEYLNTLMGHTDLIRSVAISSDGQTIASGSRDNTVRVWRSVI
ncbi:MAG: response regulator [Cyanobacteria bacterium P01_G01_bin.54]